MKETIRRELRQNLTDMKDGLRQELSERACKLLLDLPEYGRAKILMAYIPLPDELNIEPVLRSAWQDSKIVAMPKIVWEKHELKPIVTHNLDSDLIAGRHGLREPAGRQEIKLEQIDLLIVPAVGFDRRGHRMGRGGGFYDRFLARPSLRAKTVGITFAQQVLKELPVLSHDQRVQMVVTDAGVHRCKKDN
ncbi:MAG: 5-formyltetrahydrofolate cyclo-ligase [Actinobacteria bacterium]|nr:5-formyltetrahydrofolate cyclo-ligase [Actinomycetota bacterium]